MTGQMKIDIAPWYYFEGNNGKLLQVTINVYVGNVTEMLWKSRIQLWLGNLKITNIPLKGIDFIDMDKLFKIV